MRHPTEGVLRRLIDEPAGVCDTDRAHVQTCAACLTDLDAVQQDAELVSTCLATAPPAVDVDAAWRRLSATAPAQEPAARTGTRRSVSLLRRPSVAALAVAVALGGAGTAAANDWLPVFRTQQVQAVSITPGDLVALPDLSAYGALSFVSEPDLREVASAAGRPRRDRPGRSGRAGPAARCHRRARPHRRGEGERDVHVLGRARRPRGDRGG